MNLYSSINKQLPKALDGDRKAINRISKWLNVDPSFLRHNLKIVNEKIDRDAKISGKTREQVIKEAICQDLFTL